MKVKVTDRIDDNHLCHLWYGGECAHIEHNGFIALIKAIGDVYAEYAPNGELVAYVKDKNNAAVFRSEMNSYFKDDKELLAAIENGDLILDHNNWWECFIIDPHGNFHDLMWDLDATTLDEAIEEVKENLEEMIEYVKGEM